MPDLRTQIADVLDDFGLHGVNTREQAATAILEVVGGSPNTPMIGEVVTCIQIGHRAHAHEARPDCLVMVDGHCVNPTLRGQQ